MVISDFEDYSLHSVKLKVHTSAILGKWDFFLVELRSEFGPKLEQ